MSRAYSIDGGHAYEIWLEDLNGCDFLGEVVQLK
jgi:hypothetical protein